MFAQLGARGSSVLFASGDYGVGAVDCKSNDGKNVTEFQPVFPAACKSSTMVCIACWLEADRWSTRSQGPFVTAVGGTFGISPETAAPFSGGGFSRYFSQPSYQTEAVSAYIKNLNGTYNGLYKCGIPLLTSPKPPLNSG